MAYSELKVKPLEKNTTLTYDNDPLACDKYDCPVYKKVMKSYNEEKISTLVLSLVEIDHLAGFHMRIAGLFGLTQMKRNQELVSTLETSIAKLRAELAKMKGDAPTPAESSAKKTTGNFLAAVSGTAKTTPAPAIAPANAPAIAPANAQAPANAPAQAPAKPQEILIDPTNILNGFCNALVLDKAKNLVYKCTDKSRYGKKVCACHEDAVYLAKSQDSKSEAKSEAKSENNKPAKAQKARVNAVVDASKPEVAASKPEVAASADKTPADDVKA